MTICAAAICTMTVPTEPKKVVLCISDRMLTSGDIEFETSQTKMFGFAPANVIRLVAGDADAAFHIAEETHRQIVHTEETDVGMVAGLYAQEFATLRRSLAERKHLTPLGLNAGTFISRQQELDPSLVLDLDERLREEKLELEALIAGLDSTGAHIYHIGDPGQACCRDGTAFFAIGAGARQFTSQFMHLGYNRDWPLMDALLLLYSAKRRAEASPGVGRSTDILLIHEGGVHQFPATAVEALGEHHGRLEEAARRERAAVLEQMANDSRLGLGGG